MHLPGALKERNFCLIFFPQVSYTYPKIINFSNEKIFYTRLKKNNFLPKEKISYAYLKKSKFFSRTPKITYFPNEKISHTYPNEKNFFYLPPLPLSKKKKFL